MATKTKVNPVVFNGNMETRTMEVKNGQSWKAGQLLTCDSSGLTTCASDAVDIKYYALTDQDDPGAADTTALVGVITNDIVFKGNELDGSPNQTDIGTICGIDVTSNVVTVDLDDTGSHDAVQIVDVGYNIERFENSESDTCGVLYFKVLQSVIDA